MTTKVHVYEFVCCLVDWHVFCVDLFFLFVFFHVYLLFRLRAIVAIIDRLHIYFSTLFFFFQFLDSFSLPPLFDFFLSLSLSIHKQFRFGFVNFDSRALWGLCFQINEMSLTQTRTGHPPSCLSSIVLSVCFVENGWKRKRRKVQPKNTKKNA